MYSVYNTCVCVFISTVRVWRLEDGESSGDPCKSHIETWTFTATTSVHYTLV